MRIVHCIMTVIVHNVILGFCIGQTCSTIKKFIYLFIFMEYKEMFLF